MTLRSVRLFKRAFHTTQRWNSGCPLVITATEHLFQFVHTPYGSVALSWDLSIAIGTLLLRTAFTLPLSAYQQKVLSRLRNIQPLYVSWEKFIAQKLKAEAKLNSWTFEEFQFRLKSQVHSIWLI